jgi:hypothetical protein
MDISSSLPAVPRVEEVQLLTQHQILGLLPGARLKRKLQRLWARCLSYSNIVKYPIVRNLLLGWNFQK